MEKVEGQALTGLAGPKGSRFLIDARTGGAFLWRAFARSTAKARARRAIAGERASGRVRVERVERVLEEEDGTSLS